MFKWLDEIINEYFEKREAKNLGSHVKGHAKQLESAFQVKLNEVEAKYQQLLSEYQSKLETHCNLHFEMSKEKYEAKRQEFDQFIDDACERIKKQFSNDCSKQDLKGMIKDCFKSYVGEIDFAIRPRLVESVSDFESYPTSMIKTTAFSKKKEYSGGSGSNRVDFTESCRKLAHQELIEEGLELGAKLGADILFAETQQTDFSKYQTLNYGGKKITVSIILNFTFYNITGDGSQGAMPPQAAKDIITLDGLDGIGELEGDSEDA